MKCFCSHFRSVSANKVFALVDIDQDGEIVSHYFLLWPFIVDLIQTSTNGGMQIIEYADMIKPS